MVSVVSLSCPCFCTCLMLEMYQTGYLWSPLYSSDSTHPPTVFSEPSPGFLRALWVPPPTLRVDSSSSLPDSEESHSFSTRDTTPGCPWIPPTWRITQHLSPRFPPRPPDQRPYVSELQVLQANSPNLGVATSPNFRSWLASCGSYFCVASWVWKRRLDLLYVIRHEVIDPFNFTSLLLLVVEFSTHFYSLFCLPWLCSCRRFHIYTDHVHPIPQTMHIRFMPTSTQKHTLSTKTFACCPYRLRNSLIHHQCLVTGGEGVYNQWIHCDLIVIF